LASLVGFVRSLGEIWDN